MIGRRRTRGCTFKQAHRNNAQRSASCLPLAVFQGGTFSLVVADLWTSLMPSFRLLLTADATFCGPFFLICLLLTWCVDDGRAVASGQWYKNTRASRYGLPDPSLVFAFPVDASVQSTKMMGCEDHPPAHVPSHVVPVSNALLQLGGGIWTVCYVMLVVSAGRTKSYGMPMFALALNLAWEGVYALLVPGAQTIEKIGFATWLIIDCGLIHGLLTSGRRYEWAHAPLVQRHLGKIFAIMCLGCTLLHYGFATWWIANGVGMHRGKLYNGKVGPDMTELAFWSASVCQACLSVTSLCQLVIRGHSGGVSWTVWALRASGTLLGMVRALILRQRDSE